MTVVVPVQVPCDGAAETNLAPAGSWSTIATEEARSGPGPVFVAFSV